MPRILLYSLGIMLCFSAVGVAKEPLSVKSEEYDIRVVTVADGLARPWGLDWLPDGRILVTEKEGRLRIVDKDGQIGAPVSGVPVVDDGGQGGLLDVLVDSEFSTNQTVFLSYSAAGPAGTGTAVAKARLVGNGLKDLQVIFSQSPMTRSGFHFGSRLSERSDGTLFVTLGDRGERQKSQDLSVNRGQVVRINKDGTIPKDNPFVDDDKARSEIWSYGHRNVQGAALHPTSGVLWTVEHGARGGDELNQPEAGKNYGWPIISYGRHYSGLKIGEGTTKEGMEQPVHYWDPSIAPSGLSFYSGKKFPKWSGHLFVGALKYRLLVRLELKDGKVVHEERMLKKLGKRIRDVAEGPDGFIYVLTDANPGQILRLKPAGK